MALVNYLRDNKPSERPRSLEKHKSVFGSEVMPIDEGQDENSSISQVSEKQPKSGNDGSSLLAPNYRMGAQTQPDVGHKTNEEVESIFINSDANPPPS